MEEGEVVCGLFLPADEHATKAAHPPVSAFYRPAPGTETRFALECYRFFAPGAAAHRQNGA